MEYKTTLVRWNTKSVLDNLTFMCFPAILNRKVGCFAIEELRIAICEDDPEDAETLTAQIQNCDISAKTFLFENGENFMKQYHPGMYDLIFMDIYMQGLSGIDIIRQIRENDQDIPVAFTTSSTDHALESYRLDVLKYIEKPVGPKPVQETLALALLKKKNLPGLELFSNGKFVSLPFGTILYVEQKGHYLIFFLTGDRTLRIKGKLDTLETRFLSQPFFRCHKSYLVNLAFVTGLDKDLRIFHMKEGGNVHIRRESLGNAKNAWETYLFDMTRKGLHDE